MSSRFASTALLVVGLLAASACRAASVSVQVVDGGGLPVSGAVVFLDSSAARAAARPAREAQIAQIDKRFDPMVSVVTVGTAVQFPNRDRVRHHVYSFSPAKTFELKLYAGTPANPVVFDRAGIAVLGCNIHDDMVAWVVVVETPYFARTGVDGRALLPGVPDGTYRLRTWHADLPVGAPALDHPVVVPLGEGAATVRLVGTPG